MIGEKSGNPVAGLGYREELEIYKAALEQVWEDGIVTEDEEKMLASLRTNLEISLEDHKLLEHKVKQTNKISSGQQIETYRKMLAQAWSDGIITVDEKSLLSKLRNELKITDEVHNKLEQEIKTDIPSVEHEEDEDLIEDENDPAFWIQKGEEIWTSSSGSEPDAMKSIEYFDKAIELEPLNYFAWANKGLILKKIDRREEAILCYDRAISIQPNFPNSWFNKGVLLGSMGNIEDAIGCFDKVLEIAPDHSLAKRDRQMLVDILKHRQMSKVKVRTIKQS
ncbi:MAG: tetratricopeptide repeat protein [Thermoplasmata archaeon]|nr:tetratricopeptide repeat protein [Thermoplasmata archaeon]